MKEIKNNIQGTLKEKVVKSSNKISKKDWITNDMFQIMEERREQKNNDSENGRKNCRKLNNELKRITGRAEKSGWKGNQTYFKIIKGGCMGKLQNI